MLFIDRYVRCSSIVFHFDDMTFRLGKRLQDTYFVLTANMYLCFCAYLTMSVLRLVYSDKSFDAFVRLIIRYLLCYRSRKFSP